MAAQPEAVGADWLGACNRAAARIRALLDATGSIAERAIETGTTGGGGDRTLVIDAQAEQVVFDELEALHDAGARFTVVSEERGRVDYGSDDVLVVVDPIDGSLNAKRGLPHHAVSIAVADGPTIGDVAFGFVYDFGPHETWHAVRGEGAFVDGRRLDPTLRERRNRLGKLEVLGLESADPRLIAPRAEALAEVSHRVRALGAIAITLSQVAASRLDGMLTLKGCRAVDAAAGVLLVREGGGVALYPGFGDLSSPLDLEPHSQLVAARSQAALEEIAAILR